MEWISVEERLPHDWAVVLGKTAAGIVRVFRLPALMPVWALDQTCVGVKVTHWMPLPDPPRPSEVPECGVDVRSVNDLLGAIESAMIAEEDKRRKTAQYRVTP